MRNMYSIPIFEITIFFHIHSRIIEILKTLPNINNYRMIIINYTLIQLNNYKNI